MTDAYTAMDHFELGNACESQGDHDQAIEHYRHAIDLDPKFSDPHVGWGAALHAQTKYDDAIKQYQQALKKQPKYALAHYNWGLALDVLRDYEGAIREYEAAIKDDGTYMDAYLSLDNTLSELGRYAEAIAACERAIAASGDFVYAYHNKAYYLGMQGQFKREREAWEQACRIYERTKDDENNKNDADFFRYYSMALQESLWDTKQSKAMLEAGLQIDPNHTGILLDLVKLYLEWWDELKSSETDNDKKPEMYAEAKRHFMRAEHVLKERLKSGQNVETLQELGELYLAMGDNEAAKQTLEAAVKELPESPDLNVSLGVVFSQQKHYGQSAQYFEKAHLRDPNDLNVWSNLAEVYLSLNRSDLKQIEKAEAEFRKILKNAPDHIDSRIGLGETYAAMAEAGESDYFNEAIKHYSYAIGLAGRREGSKRLTSKERAGVFYSLGYAQVKLYEASRPFGDDALLSDAKKCFDLAFKLDPEHFKAEAAAEKLDKRLNVPIQRWLSDKAAPWLVLVPALFIFIYTQYRLITQSLPTLTEGSYIALTAGSLIFIIVGLFLPSIQKLKGAGIELEKVAMTQISASGSLGIRK